MIFGLRPYPSYKASGVLWLGEVPEHWKVLPNRSLFTEVRESGCPEEQLLSVTIRDGVVPQASLLRDSSKKDSSRQDKSAYKVVRTGDIAYNKMRAWQGAVGVSSYQGIVSPAYVVERSREGANPQYFHYLFRTPSFVKEAERWSYGITSDMWSLRPEHFRVIYSCVPPPPEQAAIVRFLEHVDRRISRYIRAKGKLIALLEEQKRAVIHEAVTGRIDVRTGQPYPAYKDSSVEWRGRLPKHWEVSRVKREFQCLNRYRVPLSANQRGSMKLRRYDYYGASGVIDRVDDCLFEDQLLLLAEDGANLVLRNLPLALVARGRFWVNNHAHVLKPRRGHIEYLAELMEGIDYRPWISGAAQPKLTLDRLMGIAIAVPNYEEQSRIVSFVYMETRHLRGAIARARREVELLHEYRSRLMTDVVTGRLNVREAATQFPGVDPVEPGLDSGSVSTADGRAHLDELDFGPDRAPA